MKLGARRPRQQGLVALLLAATLLLTLSTTLVLSELSQRREVGDQQALTQKRLLALRQALVNFASANGRLPCPASGAADDGQPVPANSTVAPTYLCTNRNGTVPWSVLGLTSSDTLDAWGRKISYRVYDGVRGLTRTDGASMVNCATTGTAAALAANNFQCAAVAPRTDPASVLAPATRRGLAVYDESQSTTTVWQVALVLISHGASGAGAWVPGSTTRLALPPVANAVERANGLVLNAAAVPITPDACPLPPAVMPVPPICHYRLNKSDAKVALTSNEHFDDQVVYVTFTDLFREAGRGARNW